MRLCEIQNSLTHVHSLIIYSQFTRLEINAKKEKKKGKRKNEKKKNKERKKKETFSTDYVHFSTRNFNIFKSNIK